MPMDDDWAARRGEEIRRVFPLKEAPTRCLTFGTDGR